MRKFGFDNVEEFGDFAARGEALLKKVKGTSTVKKPKEVSTSLPVNNAAAPVDNSSIVASLRAEIQRLQAENRTLTAQVQRSIIQTERYRQLAQDLKIDMSEINKSLNGMEKMKRAAERKKRREERERKRKEKLAKKQAKAVEKERKFQEKWGMSSQEWASLSTHEKIKYIYDNGLDNAAFRRATSSLDNPQDYQVAFNEYDYNPENGWRSPSAFVANITRSINAKDNEEMDNIIDDILANYDDNWEIAAGYFDGNDFIDKKLRARFNKRYVAAVGKD